MRDEMNIMGTPLDTGRIEVEIKYNRGYHLTPEERKELWKDLGVYKTKTDDEK